MDFEDLKKENLKQPIRILKNKKEQREIWQALQWLYHEGVRDYLEKIEGIKYLKSIDKDLDCVQYLLGEENVQERIRETIPGILKHDGNPKSGEIITYGFDLNNPTHIGIWQEDGTVVSKLGPSGPVLKHKWNQLPSGFANCAVYSTYSIKDFKV